MDGKKIYEMTEEEVLNHVATAIHDYLLRIRPQHSEFFLEDCMVRQVSELKMLFRSSRGLGRRDPLSPQDIQELDLTISHFTWQQQHGQDLQDPFLSLHLYNRHPEASPSLPLPDHV